MKLSVIGINHRQAPIEIRELLAIPESDYARALTAVKAELECVLLSTCNRVELYLASEGDLDPFEVLGKILDPLSKAQVPQLRPYLYVHEAIGAARHLLRMASGLDSMVLGETQILGQVRRAYQQAQKLGRTGRTLNKLFQHALYTAKGVRSETALESCLGSVPAVAASLGEKIFNGLSSRTTLIIGSGEMGQLALEAFRERGVRNFIVANRTREHAEEAARQLEARIVSLEELPSVLGQADIILSCLSCEGFVLFADGFRAAMTLRRQPVLVIDISVPRSVEPISGQIEDVYLYNVDDLETIASDNRRRLSKESAAAEKIVEREMARFTDWFPSNFSEDLLRTLRRHFDKLAAEELNLDPSRFTLEQRQEIETKVQNFLDRLVKTFGNGSLRGLSAETIQRAFDQE